MRYRLHYTLTIEAESFEEAVITGQQIRNDINTNLPLEQSAVLDHVDRVPEVFIKKVQ